MLAWWGEEDGAFHAAHVIGAFGFEGEAAAPYYVLLYDGWDAPEVVYANDPDRPIVRRTLVHSEPASSAPRLPPPGDRDDDDGGEGGASAGGRSPATRLPARMPGNGARKRARGSGGSGRTPKGEGTATSAGFSSCTVGVGPLCVHFSLIVAMPGGKRALLGEDRRVSRSGSRSSSEDGSVPSTARAPSQPLRRRAPAARTLEPAPPTRASSSSSPNKGKKGKKTISVLSDQWGSHSLAELPELVSYPG